MPSGKFVLRVPPELHRQLKQASERSGVSLNQVCTQLLVRSPLASAADSQVNAGLQLDQFQLRPLLTNLLKGLSGVEALVIFGSYARGESTPSSDIDLLIVLSPKIPLDRTLYSWWAAHIEGQVDSPLGPVFSPQFVSFPTQINKVGSLWYEVAMDGIVVWEKNREVSSVLRQLRYAIEQGKIIRKSTYGHSYWVRNFEVKNEE